MIRIYSHCGCVASEWVDVCVFTHLCDSITGYTGADGQMALGGEQTGCKDVTSKITFNLLK